MHCKPSSSQSGWTQNGSSQENVTLQTGSLKNERDLGGVLNLLRQASFVVCPQPQAWGALLCCHSNDCHASIRHSYALPFTGALRLFDCQSTLQLGEALIDSSC